VAGFAGEIFLESLFIQIRNAPQVISRAAFLPCPADGFPLEQISRHAIAFFIRGGTVHIPGRLPLSKDHDARHRPTFIFRKKQITAARRVEQIESFLIIRLGMHADAITFSSNEHHALESRNIRREMYLNTFFLGQVHVVACLLLHRSQNLFFGALDGDKNGTAWLDRVRMLPALALKERERFFVFPMIWLDLEENRFVFAADSIDLWQQFCPVCSQRALGDVAQSKTARQRAE